MVSESKGLVRSIVVIGQFDLLPELWKQGAKVYFQSAMVGVHVSM